MKKYLIVSALIAVALFGCKKENPQSPSVPVSADVPTLRVGHVGHDHHTALYVACDYGQQFAATGLRLETVEDCKRYELYDGDRHLAHVEIIKVGGGALMPTALAQEVIDIGFGGIAAVIAAVDNGSPVRLISPLHSKGDMFVVPLDSPIKTWDDFVTAAKQTQTPLKIGYKDPSAVARLIFEEALAHEGITFSQDASRSDVKVQLVNVKGGGKLNISLGSGLVDGYVGNNPFPSIAVDEKIGKIVCDLEDLPPGHFKNHPCCCIGANTDALKNKAEAISAMLVLFRQATDVINSDLDKAVAAAVHWLGTSDAVERMSIPTSGYSMTPDAAWQVSMDHWMTAMNRLGHFTGTLKDLSPRDACRRVFDLTLLTEAENRLAASAK
jgi:NitT/TauT family transport system substrate-binding protein